VRPTSIAIRVPGPRRARVVLGTALACSLLGFSATSAQARMRTVAICSAQAKLYETPGGAEVGLLHRGDRVHVSAGAGGDRWWRVVAGFGTRGWLRQTAICGHHR
jgi:hypothetical protein